MPEEPNSEKRVKNRQSDSSVHSGMSFGDEEEEDKNDNYLDSPKGSVNSQSSFFDESQIEDEEDEFEDAQEGPSTKILSNSE